MAFFSFRSAGRKGGADAVPNGEAETVEAMRRRARHRLIGATVLVALGVIGFPVLFDTQPRPVAVDIPIDIPDKNKVAPLPAPARAAQQAGSAPAVAAGGSEVGAQSSLSGREQLVAAGAAAAKAAKEQKGPGDQQDTSQPAPDNRADAGRKPGAEKTADKSSDKSGDKARAIADAAPAKPDAKAAAREEELRVVKAEEAARARALLEGKSAKQAAKAAEGRFIVQVGAFSESERARETRAKVERAGLRTYTQETKTAGGTWIGVRVGPFATRAEADEAAEKIKGLSLPASILSL